MGVCSSCVLIFVSLIYFETDPSYVIYARGRVAALATARTRAAVAVGCCWSFLCACAMKNCFCFVLL